MARLGTRDLLALLHVVEDLYGFVDANGFGERVVGVLGMLVRGDATTYSDLDLRRAVPLEVSDRPAFVEPAARERFSRYMHESPLIAHYARTGDGRARKVSDIVTLRQLRRTAFYNEYARPICGTEYQIAVATRASRSRVIGISVARSGRDFSERDRLLLDLLRPHLVRATETTRLVAQLADAVAAPFTRPEDSDVRGLVAIDPTGCVRLMTSRARQLLQAYFGRPRATDRLPDVVRAWVRANDRRLRHTDAPRPLEPLVVSREHARLTLWQRRTTEGLVLLMEERLDVRPGRAPLTPREAEVLKWVAEGKTSAETAVIIGTRPRTVDKHLQHIFTKLGVENRTTAAIMLARRPVPTE